MLLSVLPTRLVGTGPGDEVTFASSGFRLTLTVPDGGVPRLQALRNATTGFDWCRPEADFGPVFATAAPRRGWIAQPGRRRKTPTGRRYEFTAAHAASGVEAHYALHGFADAPVIELQTTFRNTDRQPLPAVTEFGALRLGLRGDMGPLRVHAVNRRMYKLETFQVPEAGGPTAEPIVDITGGQWGPPAYGGLLVLEAVDAGEFLFVGVEWERDWHYRITREPDGLWLTLALADLTHDMTVGEQLTAPRTFLGLAQGDRDRAFITAQHYLKRHVFVPPLKDSPWVVYNFWGTEASGVEEALLREVDFAAELGVELFYQDAGWYQDSSKDGSGDWFAGLGNYREDRQKYPGGLAAISRKSII